MTLINRYILLTLALVLSLVHAIEAQERDTVQTKAGLDYVYLDGKLTLSLEDFYTIILANHPVASQARLYEEIARQEIRLARGAFDPVLGGDYDYKNFSNTEYWDILSSELKIPVWFGTDLKLGYDRADGTYLSDERTFPDNGLLTAGFSVPLGRDLIIDGRRAALRQAQLLPELAEADRIKLINKLLLDATKFYWDWYFAHQNLTIQEEGINLARERFKLLRQNMISGDNAPLDTVEALITLQTREIEFKQAQLEYQNASIRVSNFIWSENQEPLELNEIFPAPSGLNFFELTLSDLERLRNQAAVSHPELIRVNTVLKQLEIERQLAKNNLLPSIKANYNFLQEYTRSPEFPNQGFFREDYKWGLSVYIPLFMRKERAKMQLTNVKLQQTSYDRNILNREILNEINAVYNELLTLKGLTEMQQQVVINNEAMLRGELLKFRNGESTLFLVNTRENNLLSARMKLLDLNTKYQKARATLYWAAGVPNLTDL
ncbi:TolC family protein [Penaeicola halotolerans]|uniref:TolC family protein n=1 Tax=Penaeicola halotolerans TaxID=2793196 RepID=UPI001CF83AA5|nr:TolC family protein [Penaeicola halotolerans]